MTATRNPRDRSAARLSRADTPPTADEQRQLCRQAKRGDPDAANQLARLVQPWVYTNSARYVKMFGTDVVEQEELIAIAYSKVPVAIQTYDGSGIWTGWFFTIAGREFSKVCEQLARHKSLRIQTTDDCPTLELAPSRHTAALPADHLIDEAIAYLTPLERRIYCERVGYRCRRKVPVRRIARQLGRTFNDIERIHLRASEHVRRWVIDRADTLADDE